VPGGSIYVPSDEKFTGASPQNLYETFWLAGRKNRLRVRAALAVGGFLVGDVLAARLGVADAFLAGLIFALVAPGVHLAITWWLHERTAVWRGRRRGEVRTRRLLRFSLRRHGYRVMDGRAVPGQASIDHLVIGPSGVWIIDNEAWPPETRIARYGKRLFFDEKFGTSVAKGLIEAAASMAELLSRETGIQVRISPLLAVHGGKIVGRGGVIDGEGLTIAYPHKVASWIRTEPVKELSEEQIELLARTAARILRSSLIRL
jgi:hypothetical protein